MFLYTLFLLSDKHLFLFFVQAVQDLQVDVSIHEKNMNKFLVFKIKLEIGIINVFDEK